MKNARYEVGGMRRLPIQSISEAFVHDDSPMVISTAIGDNMHIESVDVFTTKDCENTSNSKSIMSINVSVDKDTFEKKDINPELILKKTEHVDGKGVHIPGRLRSEPAICINLSSEQSLVPVKLYIWHHKGSIYMDMLAPISELDRSGEQYCKNCNTFNNMLFKKPDDIICVECDNEIKQGYCDAVSEIVNGKNNDHEDIKFDDEFCDTCGDLLSDEESSSGRSNCFGCFTEAQD